MKRDKIQASPIAQFAPQSGAHFESLQQRWQQFQFSRKLQLAFLEDLDSLIQDGVPASQAIDTIREISTGVTKTVALHIAHGLAQGQQLADGMRRWFKPAIVEIIRAGENSGTLKLTLSSATQALSQQTNAVSTLFSALIYPALVLALALGLTVFIKQSVLESFLRIKPLAQWPSVGQDLYHLADITQHWWWFGVLLTSLIVAVVIRVLHHFTGDGRHQLDQLPLFSLYRNTAAARFMQTLGLLITNGIMLKKALNIMQFDASPYLAWHLLLMEYRLSGGMDNIADVLDTQLIQKRDLVRLRVVAKGKGFERALLSLGQQAQTRNIETIERTARILNGVLLALAASLAATMVFGIYTVGSSVVH